MSFQPEKITREHVLAAVEQIEQRKLKLNPSIGYDVVINQKRYPPKEIIRIANQIAIDEDAGIIYGGEYVNKHLRGLGFEIVEKNKVWKLGCNWGKGTPSFYNFIRSESIVLTVNAFQYEPGDIIVITEGFTVYAIAIVKSLLFPITSFDKYVDQCKDYNIDYEDWVYTAEAEWYELKSHEVFTYKLQQGIRRVRSREVIDKVFDILETINSKQSQIIFYTKAYHDRPGKSWQYPCIALVPDSWNDYGYSTTHELYFYQNSENRVEIGTVKILQEGETITKLPAEFIELSDKYCSLGQTAQYYRLLEEIPIDKMKILSALNDCTYSKAILRRFENHEGFKTSLLRSSEAQSLLNLEDNKIYNFTFNFKLPSADEAHSVNIQFNTERELKNNFFCIIGKNGTGKTQFLTKLANKLNDIREEGEIYPERPPFSGVISASFSYFDKFRIPERKDTSYTFIGLRNEEGLIGEEQFRNLLWSAYKSLITNRVKKELWLKSIHDIIDIEFLDFNINELESLVSKDEFLDKIDDVFSSGQKIVFQFVTRLINVIEVNSLIIFDEPETHLHPNIAARLFNSLNKILTDYQSFCIVATHSPIVVQEIPSRFIRIFDRQGNTPLIYEPIIECFGENLSIISNSIFHVDEEKELYKTTLKTLLNSHSISQIEEIFRNKLSLNAKLYLQLKNHG